MSVSEFVKRAKKNVAKRKEIPEIKIENTFVTYAEKKGCKCYKLVFLVGKGFPDRTILCPGGKIFFIEFKRKGKKPNKHQNDVRKILIGLGFEYYVCDKLGQAEKYLDLFLLTEVSK